MTDLASYLHGWVAGYWQGYDFGLNPTRDGGEDEGGSAGGDADAAAVSPGPDPGASKLAQPADAGRVPPGSRPSDTLPLPAIRQPALPNGVEVGGAFESIYVHRGMITALAMMVEAFRDRQMHAAASICERAVRGIAVEDERR